MKLYRFFGQVAHEVKRVAWPTKKELMLSTVVVIVAVIVVGLVSLVVDYAVHNVISFLLGIGG